MGFRLRPPKKPKLTENDVEKACLDVLRLHGYYPLRLQSGRFWTLDKKRVVTCGEPGIPDYVIPMGFVETKAPGEDLSEVQRAKIEMLAQHWDLPTAVVGDVDELLAWLREHGK